MERIIKVGDSSSVSKVFQEEDLKQFASLSLDDNPVHLDHEFAKDCIFGKQIVHGFLYGSLISAVIGTKLPGVGTIYMQQSMRFTRPVFIGDEVTATVTVSEIIEGKGIALLDTKVTKNGKVEVLTGEATVKLP